MPFSINNSIFVCLWNCVCVEIWWKFSTSENLEFLVELNNFQTNRKNLKSFFSLMAILLSLYVWGSLKTYPWFRIVDYSHFHNVIFGSFWYPRDQWEAKAYIPDTDWININIFLPNVILYSAKYWNEHVDFMWIFNFKAVNVSYLTFQIVNDGPKRTDSSIFTITNLSPFLKPENLSDLSFLWIFPSFL